jgi:hypothetical protein
MVTISAPASGKQRQDPEPDHPPRRDVREETRDEDRGGQQCQRERQDARAGLERGQAEGHRQVEGYDEEHPHLYEVLEEEHRQATGELLVLEHGRVDEWLPVPPRDADLPPEEQPDDEQPCQHQPDDQ